MKPGTFDGDVEDLIDAAQAHGAAGEPDHEVGDLQEIARSCWAALTPAAQKRVYRDQKDLLDTWGKTP